MEHYITRVHHLDEGFLRETQSSKDEPRRLPDVREVFHNLDLSEPEADCIRLSGAIFRRPRAHQQTLGYTRAHDIYAHRPFEPFPPSLYLPKSFYYVLTETSTESYGNISFPPFLISNKYVPSAIYPDGVIPSSYDNN